MQVLDQLQHYNSLLRSVLGAIKSALDKHPDDPAQKIIQAELFGKLEEIQLQLTELDQEIVELSANVLEIAAGSHPPTPSPENQS